MSYLIDIFEQNGASQRHEKALETDRAVTIGTEADCEIRLVDRAKPIKLYVRALQAEFQVKNVRAGVFTGRRLKTIVLNKLYRIGTSSFIYIREQASPPPPSQAALFEAAEELEGGGETMATEPDAKHTSSYTDLYAVDLSSIVKEQLKAVFGTEPVATFDVDMTLWSFLTTRRLTREVEKLPDLDDMEWLVPGDSPKTAEDPWAKDRFTSQDLDVVDFKAVEETVGDVLGADVQSATEVYSRLWRFIFERKLIRRTSLA